MSLGWQFFRLDRVEMSSFSRSTFKGDFFSSFPFQWRNWQVPHGHLWCFRFLIFFISRSGPRVASQLAAQDQLHQLQQRVIYKSKQTSVIIIGGEHPSIPVPVTSLEPPLSKFSSMRGPYCAIRQLCECKDDGGVSIDKWEPPLQLCVTESEAFLPVKEPRRRSLVLLVSVSCQCCQWWRSRGHKRATNEPHMERKGETGSR